MRKFFSIAEIILFTAGGASIIYAFINWFAFRTALDASNAFYHAKQQLALRFLVLGLLALFAGIAAAVIKNRHR